MYHHSFARVENTVHSNYLSNVFIHGQLIESEVISRMLWLAFVKVAIILIFALDKKNAIKLQFLVQL